MNRIIILFNRLGKRINREERFMWVLGRVYERMRLANIRFECGEKPDQLESAIRDANRLIKLWEKWGNRTSSR